MTELDERLGASRRRRAVRGIVTAIGAVAILLALDVAVGFAFGSASTEGASPSSSTHRYATFYGLEPVAGWERPTEGRDGDGSPDATVWVLGGSVAFGRGREDDGTVGARLAELAADAGTDLEVRTFAQDLGSSLQTSLLLEQLLAQEERPDAVVIIDGVEDIEAAAAFEEPAPATVLAPLLSARYGNRRIRTETAAPGDPTGAGGLPGALLALHREHAASRKLARWVTELGGEDDPQRAPVDPEPLPAELRAGLRSAAAGERAAAVLERATWLAEVVAAPDGVPVLRYLQPVAGDRAGEAALRSSLPDGVVDLTERLGPDAADAVVDDQVLTEAGASSIAAELWTDLEPELRGA